MKTSDPKATRLKPAAQPKGNLTAVQLEFPFHLEKSPHEEPDLRA